MQQIMTISLRQRSTSFALITRVPPDLLATFAPPALRFAHGIDYAVSRRILIAPISAHLSFQSHNADRQSNLTFASSSKPLKLNFKLNKLACKKTERTTYNLTRQRRIILELSKRLELFCSFHACIATHSTAFNNLSSTFLLEDRAVIGRFCI